ncbi:unnamed protein product, partial [Amoebophrya sp. A120]
QYQSSTTSSNFGRNSATSRRSLIPGAKTYHPASVDQMCWLGQQQHKRSLQAMSKRNRDRGSASVLLDDQLRNMPP